MTQTDLDFTRTNKTGGQLRDEGMDRAASNSGDWKEAAKDSIYWWFRLLPPGMVFMGEDIRFAVRGRVGEPHHHNAWSAVIGGRVRRWLKQGLIEVVGYAPCRDKTTHAHIVRQYRKVG